GSRSSDPSDLSLRFSFHLTLPGLEQTTLRRGEIRTTPQNAGVLRNGLVSPTLGKVGAAQVVVRLSVIGLEANGFLKTKDGLGNLPLVEQVGPLIQVTRCLINVRELRIVRAGHIR